MTPEDLTVAAESGLNVRPEGYAAARAVERVVLTAELTGGAALAGGAVCHAGEAGADLRVEALVAGVADADCAAEAVAVRAGHAGAS